MHNFLKRNSNELPSRRKPGFRIMNIGWIPAFAGMAVFLICLASPSFAVTVRNENIAVIVNDGVVTTTDIAARMKLIMSSSGLPDVADVRDKVRTQVTAMLTEEKIKSQEADRLRLSVDAADIDGAIATIAEQNKMGSSDFQKMLQSRGIKIDSLRDQIKSQLLWARVVARQIRPKITIYDRDIDAELSRSKGMVGQTEYALFDILLPTGNKKETQNAYDLASKIMTEVKQRPAAFPALARQFSKAPGAQMGGAMGFVDQTQLDPDLRKIVVGAKAGAVLGPIKTHEGLHIIHVGAVRTRTEKDLPTRDDIQKRLFMERVERLQNAYYQDLRASAFIQTK